MINSNVQKILDDLYALEPALRGKEAEIVGLIEDLLRSRPGVEPDEDFVRELRSKLLTRAGELEAAPESGLIFKLNNMRKLMYFASGAAVCLLAILPAYYWQMNQSGNKSIFTVLDKQFSGPVFSQLSINKLEGQAFGKINLPAQSAAPMGMGGGGGLGAAESSTRSFAAGDAAAVDGDTQSSKMIMPAPMTYKYVYKGEKIDLSGITGDVLRRIKGAGQSSDLVGAVSGANLGLVDMGKFRDLGLQNISIAENRDFGYMVGVNFEDSSVYISENWIKWQNTPANRCADEKCLQEYRIKITDVLPDNQMITMANAFLEEYGIDKSAYGEPSVDQRWRDEYARAENKEFAWIPEVMTVVYPLVINGQTVYDEWGNPQGLSVSVNLRAKKVSGLYGLQAQKYDSSTYEIESDEAKLREVLGRGGRNQWYYIQGGETKEVEVGDPQVVMVKVYKYDGPQTDELIVPALLFPVKEGQAGVDIWHKNVVVPLVKDLLEMPQGMGGGPIIMEDAARAEGGSSADDAPVSTQIMPEAGVILPAPTEAVPGAGMKR